MYSVEENLRLLKTLRCFILEDLLIKLRTTLRYSSYSTKRHLLNFALSFFDFSVKLKRSIKWLVANTQGIAKGLFTYLLKGLLLPKSFTKSAIKKVSATGPKLRLIKFKSIWLTAKILLKTVHKNGFQLMMSLLQIASSVLLISIILNNLSISFLGIDRLANSIMEFIISGRVIGSEYYIKLSHFYALIGVISIHYLFAWAMKLNMIFKTHNKNKAPTEQFFTNSSAQISLTIKESAPTHLYIRTI